MPRSRRCVADRSGREGSERTASIFEATMTRGPAATSGERSSPSRMATSSAGASLRGGTPTRRQSRRHTPLHVLEKADPGLGTARRASSIRPGMLAMMRVAPSSPFHDAEVGERERR